MRFKHGLTLSTTSSGAIENSSLPCSKRDSPLRYDYQNRGATRHAHFQQSIGPLAVESERKSEERKETAAFFGGVLCILLYSRSTGAQDISGEYL